MDQNIITRHECEIILELYVGHKNFELLDYFIQPLSDGNQGYMGEYYCLTIKFKNHNSPSTTTFFLKTQPFQNELQLEFSKQSGAFENEIFFYDTLIPEYKKYYNFDDSFIPKFYLSKDNSAIVLQNCTPDGFKIVEKNELDVRHIQIVLKALAKLHAASIIYEENKSKELKRPYHLIEDYAKYFQDKSKEDENHFEHQMDLACQKCIHSSIDLIPERDDLTRTEFKEKFLQLAHPLKFINNNKKYRNVCCHGDMWGNNVMFKYETGTPMQCKVIDFQLLKYFPPVYDVLRFMYLSTSTKWRRRHMDSLINLYYKCLCKDIKSGGVNADEVLSYDHLMASVKELLPYIKIQMAYCFFNKLFDDIMVENKEVSKELLFNSIPAILKRYSAPDSSVKYRLDEVMREVGDVIVELF